MHQDLDEASIILHVFLKEERMTDLLHNQVVDKDSQLISQALILQLVALLDDSFKGFSQSDNNSRIVGHRPNSWLSDHLDKVPNGVEGDAHSVRPEVGRLLENSD